MRLALALAVTIALGLTLAMVRYGWLQLPNSICAGSICMPGGWQAGYLLLAGVGMEIIPLFYISPAFAAGLKRSAVCGDCPVAAGGRTAGLPSLAQALAVARLRFCRHLLCVQRQCAVRPEAASARAAMPICGCGSQLVAVFAAFFAWFSLMRPTACSVSCCWGAA